MILRHGALVDLPLLREETLRPSHLLIARRSLAMILRHGALVNLPLLREETLRPSHLLIVRTSLAVTLRPSHPLIVRRSLAMTLRHGALVNLPLLREETLRPSHLLIAPQTDPSLSLMKTPHLKIQAIDELTELLLPELLPVCQSSSIILIHI